MTIAQIILSSFQPTIRHILGQHHAFADPKLRQMVESGQITLGKVGPKFATIKVPLAWTSRDDSAPTHKRIQTAADLLQNGVYCHDDLLLQIIGSRPAIVSERYRYVLTGLMDLPWDETNPDEAQGHSIQLVTSFQRV